MQNLYEKILEKWFYKDNEKVVRLTDIKEIFENATEESVPLDLLVMPKIAEAIDRTKWKLKGIIRTKTMNMEDGFDKQILLKIGEIQIDVCDAVMEEILSNFSA